MCVSDAASSSGYLTVETHITTPCSGSFSTHDGRVQTILRKSTLRISTLTYWLSGNCNAIPNHQSTTYRNEISFFCNCKCGEEWHGLTRGGPRIRLRSSGCAFCVRRFNTPTSNKISALQLHTGRRRQTVTSFDCSRPIAFTRRNER
jgi:hypothetical protein